MSSTKGSARHGIGIGVAALVGLSSVAMTATPSFAVSSDGATSQATSSRIGGVDRYDTAAQIAEAYWSNPGTVIVANGESGVDALTASYLAGVVDAPILLTKDGSVDAKTLAAITKLNPAKVVVIGGEKAVSTAVYGQLTAGRTGDRISGADRYETAANIVEYVGGNPTAAFVASGTAVGGGVPADALAAGPLAFRAHIPILLTNPRSVTDRTNEVLAKLRTVHVLGGEQAVPASILAAIRLGGTDVDRISGKDRSATAVQLAQSVLMDQADFSRTSISIVNGASIDGLTFGPAAGKSGRPMLVTNNATSIGSVQQYLTDRADQIRAVGFVGGAASLPQTVVEQVQRGANIPVGVPGTVTTVLPVPSAPAAPQAPQANLDITDITTTLDQFFGSARVELRFDRNDVPTNQITVYRERLSLPLDCVVPGAEPQALSSSLQSTSIYDCIASDFFHEKEVVLTSAADLEAGVVVDTHLTNPGQYRYTFVVMASPEAQSANAFSGPAITFSGEAGLLPVPLAVHEDEAWVLTGSAPAGSLVQAQFGPTTQDTAYALAGIDGSYRIALPAEVEDLAALTVRAFTVGGVPLASVSGIQAPQSVAGVNLVVQDGDAQVTFDRRGIATGRIVVERYRLQNLCDSQHSAEVCTSPDRVWDVERVDVSQADLQAGSFMDPEVGAGEYFYAVTVLPAGGGSAHRADSNLVDVVVDQQVATPTVQSLVMGMGPVTLSGNAPVGSLVKVSVSGFPAVYAVTAANGTWQKLVDGALSGSYTVRAFDTAGRPSAPAFGLIMPISGMPGAGGPNTGPCFILPTACV